MVVEKRVYLIKKNLNLFRHPLTVFVVADLIVAIIFLVLYGRARMKEQEQREKLFFRIHTAALIILMITGIIYMMVMVEADN